MATKKIRILLTDANTGTWAVNGKTIITGHRLPQDQDYWKLVEDIQPAIGTWLQSQESALRADGELFLVDPNGTDIGGQPVAGGDIVCQFRLLDGNIEASI